MICRDAHNNESYCGSDQGCCINAEGWLIEHCCPSGTTCCVDVGDYEDCCEPDEVCTIMSGRGTCCPVGTSACGREIDDGQQYICCGPDETCCAVEWQPRRCCPSGQTCTADGDCE